jgi:Ca2+-binding EF-hand superfamily protein
MSTNKLEMVMEACGHPTTELGVKKIIAEVDPMRRGRINIDTFLTLMSDRLNKTEEIPMEELFKVLDRNLDGKIGAGELNYLMANLGTYLN